MAQFAELDKLLCHGTISGICFFGQRWPMGNAVESLDSGPSMLVMALPTHA